MIFSGDVAFKCNVPYSNAGLKEDIKINYYKNNLSNKILFNITSDQIYPD